MWSDNGIVGLSIVTRLHHGTMQESAIALKPAEKSCPLCSGVRFRSLDKFPVADLCAEYRRQLQVDVRNEFDLRILHLDLNECLGCGLQFFSPLVSGSPGFYSSLSSCEAYYSSCRWEFAQALGWIGDQARVIDVGCGDGHFLSLIAHGNKVGLEFNPDAVARARARGLEVRREGLSEIADRSADVITFFQVLEHFVNPLEMLREAARSLSSSGLLLVSVPNNDAFMGDAIQHPSNAPPHHPLRWTKKALRFLPTVLPFLLREIVDEPMSREQLFLYRRTLITRAVARCLRTRVPLMRLNPATILLRKAANALTLVSLKFHSRLPAGSVSGHSMLAIYQKTA